MPEKIKQPDIKPLMLMILDGWGIAPPGKGNAVSLARTPALDRLSEQYPSTELLCSGKSVGLPPGIMGNSEVGHLNIGAGRIVYQDLLRIDMAIKDKTFFDNEAFNRVISKVKSGGKTLHLMGLVSDGGVHSQLNHLLALLDMTKAKGVSQVYVHAILDGRDTSPESGAGYMGKLQEHIDKIGFGAIATVCGRFYALDRDKRWERVEKAFNLYTLGIGIEENDPVEAVKKAYKRGETDEFVKPVIINNSAVKPSGILKDGDGLIFFNFRADRAREITRALTEPGFNSFNISSRPNLCGFVCMTMYDESFTLPTAFAPVHMDKILGEVISKNGLNQLRIAETEKYAHVTYFFNGGEEKSFPNEDRCVVPSLRDVETYDLKPEMSAEQVDREVISRIKEDKYHVIILNFANMDMVGHTGIIKAAIKACETVDLFAGQVVKVIQEAGGTVLITADHGNAEKMLAENGQPHTAHTLNPVPLILVDDTRKGSELKAGSLRDIAPTILDILGIDKPEEMTGTSLIK